MQFNPALMDCYYTPKRNKSDLFQQSKFVTTASVYSQYLSEFESKIESICAKEAFRDYLNEQTAKNACKQAETQLEQLRILHSRKVGLEEANNNQLRTELNTLSQSLSAYQELQARIKTSLREKKSQLLAAKQEKSLLELEFKQNFKAGLENDPNFSLPSFMKPMKPAAKTKRQRKLQNAAAKVQQHQDGLQMLNVLLIYFKAQPQLDGSEEILHALVKAVDYKSDLLDKITALLKSI